MSNQSNSSVYSEKKIAAYESLFKESSFAKPQEVYLTITVAHLFGQAYIMEQQGTKEGDPVYSRFVCNLEDITKVYINDNVKASPLFIQCDTDVKGVIHRKRIIVPCLDNVAAIVEQIKEVQANHMEKYEAAQEREKQKKRQQLEEARMKEQIKHEAEEKIPPLPVVEKIDINETVAAEKTSSSAKAMNDEAVKALKELEKIEINITKPVIKVSETLNSEKNTADKSNADEIASIDKIPESVSVSAKTEAVQEFEEIQSVDAVPEPVPKAPEAQVEALDIEAALKAAEEAALHKSVKAAKTEADKHEVKVETLPDITPIDRPAAEEKTVETAPAPVVEKKPVPVPARVNPNGTASSLADFETAVKKLKTMKDNGVISDEEFAEEKKKLLASLY